jgi:hypothetical protein
MPLPLNPPTHNSSQPATFEQAMDTSLRRHTQAVTFGTALPPPLDCDVLSQLIEDMCLTAGHNKSTPTNPTATRRSAETYQANAPDAINKSSMT